MQELCLQAVAFLTRSVKQTLLFGYTIAFNHFTLNSVPRMYQQCDAGVAVTME